MTPVRSIGAFILGSLLLAPRPSLAQESKSAPLAVELCKLLDAQKLDSIAARQAGDQYVGALYFSGSQLLVVKGKFPSFSRMDDLLTKREFKEVYICLLYTSDAADERSSV